MTFIHYFGSSFRRFSFSIRHFGSSIHRSYSFIRHFNFPHKKTGKEIYSFPVSY
ncbi:hypothetical protein [Lysinibacillus sp. fls2-241-R2A-57]|uniref:hypothetical protein n=1 Tax=Lysinibacillus sp. fls2-241-R2A-57 TaxID=3040292 RepID=UPI0025528E5B|nr:hypothetical protein [Lysinibacillus sp. fls2-241-R2A-57]